MVIGRDSVVKGHEQGFNCQSQGSLDSCKRLLVNGQWSRVTYQGSSHRSGLRIIGQESVVKGQGHDQGSRSGDTDHRSRVTG